MPLLSSEPLLFLSLIFLLFIALLFALPPLGSTSSQCESGLVKRISQAQMKVSQAWLLLYRSSPKPTYANRFVIFVCLTVHLFYRNLLPRVTSLASSLGELMERTARE